jgi:hypothetical protein
MDKVLATMLAHLSLNITLAVGGASLASVVFWQTLAGEYVLAMLALVALSARPPNVPAIVPVAGKPHDSTATQQRNRADAHMVCAIMSPQRAAHFAR